MSGHELDRLSPYLDGELTAEVEAEVRAHLQACAECRAELDLLRLTDEAARELPVAAPNGYFEDFAGRVAARIEAEAPPRVRAAPPLAQPHPGLRRSRPRFVLPVWTWAVAAALLLAIVTPLTLRQMRPIGETAPAPQASGSAANEMRPLDETAPRRQAAGSDAAHAGRDDDRRGRSLPKAADEAPVGLRLEQDARGRAGVAQTPPTAVAEPDARRTREAKGGGVPAEVAASDGAAARPTPPAPAGPAPAAAPPAPKLEREVASQATEGGVSRRDEGSARSLEPAGVAAAVGGSAVPLPARLAEKETVFDAVGEDAPRKQSANRDAEALAAREQAVEARDKRKRSPSDTSAAPAVGLSAAKSTASRPEAEFELLAARAPQGAVEWRALRDEWQAFARTQGAASLLGDEACVRAIAAGLELVRIAAEPADERAVREAVRAYLARPEARHKARVRELVETAASRR